MNSIDYFQHQEGIMYLSHNELRMKEEDDRKEVNMRIKRNTHLVRAANICTLHMLHVLLGYA